MIKFWQDCTGTSQSKVISFVDGWSLRKTFKSAHIAKIYNTGDQDEF